MKALLAGLAFVSMSALAAGAADKNSGGDFNVTLGYDRTVGKYDQRRDTTLSTSSATATWDVGDYSLDILVPYLDEKGPGRVIFLPGRRPVVIVGTDRMASGLGDVTAGVTRYVLDQETHGVDLDLDAIVKFGTASSRKGLGTGKDDLSIQAALGGTFAGIDGTLTTGYTFVGKAPNLGLTNSFYGSFDLSYKIAAPVRVGATYSAGQTSAQGTAGSRDGTAYVEFRLAKTLKAELYWLKGWSTQSPDRGGGITLGWDL